MSRHKLHQVPLVSDKIPAQPPFPGGWAVAIFDAIYAFAPYFARDHQLPVSPRTRVRIRGGEPMKQITYDEIEKRLVEVTVALFPKTAELTRCVGKYVNEYFRLWKFAAESAPVWTRVFGFAPSPSGVIARALLRDLLLRLCYLESCERRLRGEIFSEWELSLLRHDSSARVYRGLIGAQMQSHGIFQADLADELNLNVKTLREFMNGKRAPQLAHLRALMPQGENSRLLAGIGFFDALLKNLDMQEGAHGQEILQWAESFLPSHRPALGAFPRLIPHSETNQPWRGKSCDFEVFVTDGENLLLHPGCEVALATMPDALARCHLYALMFAQLPELARAYVQFADPENDRGLVMFLESAEAESDRCPYRWMEKLRQRNNVQPFRE